MYTTSSTTDSVVNDRAPRGILPRRVDTSSELCGNIRKAPSTQNPSARSRRLSAAHKH